MKKKTLSMIMGLILGVTTVFGSIGTTAVTVSAASGEVTDADLLTIIQTPRLLMKLYRMPTSTNIRKMNWQHSATSDQIPSMR